MYYIRVLKVTTNLLILVLVGLGCQKDIINTASIEGKVLLSGIGASNVSVKLASRMVNHSATADTDGNYTFGDLPRGDYTVSSASGNNSGSVSAQINTDGQIVTADINLNPPPSSGGGGSCPYIYVFNGEKYIFNGDIYAGAIYSNLERHDYTPLFGLKEVEGKYRIRISNELQERQYTNLTELLVIHHPDSVHPLFDKEGKLYTISKPVSPKSAFSPIGVDYSAYLQKADGHSYLFNEENSKELSWKEEITNLIYPHTGKNALLLTFDKKNLTRDAKFVVKAKNSNWSVFLWHEFTSLFGDHFNEWRESQSKLPSAELLAWRENEGIPLMVYIETEKGWEFISCFNIVGSVISREMIMPLDLTKVHGDKLKLKLECAFMFWELDYAAIDYSEQVTCQCDKISLLPDSDSLPQDLLIKLQADDNLHLEHLNTGDMNDLTFGAAKENKNGSETIFLHSKGFYEQKVDFTRSPDYLKLLGFLRPGSFAQYSMDRFHELSRGSDMAIVQKK